MGCHECKEKTTEFENIRSDSEMIGSNNSAGVWIDSDGDIRVWDYFTSTGYLLDDRRIDKWKETLQGKKFEVFLGKDEDNSFVFYLAAVNSQTTPTIQGSSDLHIGGILMDYLNNTPLLKRVLSNRTDSTKNSLASADTLSILEVRLTRASTCLLSETSNSSDLMDLEFPTKIKRRRRLSYPPPFKIDDDSCPVSDINKKILDSDVFEIEIKERKISTINDYSCFDIYGKSAVFVGNGRFSIDSINGENQTKDFKFANVAIPKKCAVFGDDDGIIAILIESPKSKIDIIDKKSLKSHSIILKETIRAPIIQMKLVSRSALIIFTKESESNLGIYQVSLNSCHQSRIGLVESVELQDGGFIMRNQKVCFFAKRLDRLFRMEIHTATFKFNEYQIEASSLITIGSRYDRIAAKRGLSENPIEFLSESED